jgi:SAM-dependent methyltransferase
MPEEVVDTSRIKYERCPLCESSDIVEFCKANCSKHQLYRPVIPPVMTWMRCGSCGHVFTDGYFRPEVASAIFAKTHEHQKPGSRIEQQRDVSATMVARVVPYVSGGPWLDVGFGNGSLLFTAAEFGFRPVGIDLRPTSVEAMRRFGVEAHCIDLTNFTYHEPLSVISFADVLEHMAYPRKALVAAGNLLSPAGVLLVSVPNYGSPVWRYLDAAKANPYWGELEHFHNFSRERLYNLMREHGFEPLRYDISRRYRVSMEVLFRPRAGVRHASSLREQQTLVRQASRQGDEESSLRRPD